VKGLRYNAGAGTALASATLTDCDGAAPLLVVDRSGPDHGKQDLSGFDPSAPVWLWNASSEPMPSFPPRLQFSDHAAPGPQQLSNRSVIPPDGDDPHSSASTA